jgi:hypothetical protein
LPVFSKRKLEHKTPVIEEERKLYFRQPGVNMKKAIF